MDESLPGERPDTVHLEGLPCRWFAPRESGGGNGGSGSGATTASGGGTPAPGSWDRPSEELLRQAFGTFGEVRHVDIPMLDPYRGEAAGRGFHGFGAFGGSLHFEAYVQYRDYAGFARAMAALRGMKLMLKGEDGKAVACNIKVSFDSTKHLSDASIRKRQLERQKLQELERRREEQKRRERQAEERRREEELKQREAECQERARRREEKLLRREQRQRERERRRGRRRRKEEEEEEQRQLQGRIREEERKLLLAQRALQSIRLVAELLGRAEAARLRQDEQRRLQEAELRRVEREKERALGLQRRERELRQRLLALLLGRRPGSRISSVWSTNNSSGIGNNSGTGNGSSETGNGTADTRNNTTGDLLQPVLDILHSVTAMGQGPIHTEGHTLDDVTAPTESCTSGDAPNHPATDNATPKATLATGPPTQPSTGDPDPSEEHDPEHQTRHDRKQPPLQHRKRSGEGESGAAVDRREEREWSRRDRKRSHSRRHSSSRHGVDQARSSRSRSPRRRGAWHR
ncbi:A-kinase anchor protein 17A-like isoform X2 [Acomys russatus]|nr:A-kinase anchor protein 17A-like isoform X2 [Acomys russatus]